MTDLPEGAGEVLPVKPDLHGVGVHETRLHIMAARGDVDGGQNHQRARHEAGEDAGDAEQLARIVQ